MKLALAALMLGAFNLGIAVDHVLFIGWDNGAVLVGGTGLITVVGGGASAWLELAYLRLQGAKPRSRDAKGRFTKIASQGDI